MLRIDRLSANGHAALTSNGKEITIVNTDKNVFTTAAAPPTLDALVDMLRVKLHVDAPGGDFLADDPFAVLTVGLKEGRYLGVEPVDGLMAHHLLLSGTDTDAEVWIADGAQPLPLRYVVTSKDMKGQPQFTLELRNWQVNANPTRDTFTLAPPANAKRLDFNALPPPQSNP
jgi:hypothetical protein